MVLSFCNVNNISNSSDENAAAITRLNTIFYVYATPCICLIGIGGNILNLITLVSSTLQTVPFMYIRSIAAFDLIAMSAIFISCILRYLVTTNPQFNIYALLIYLAHIDSVIINTFLVSSLYCALVLTLERRPHLRRIADPKRMARYKILLSFLFALVLHLPMSLQFILRFDTNTNDYAMGNNMGLLCRQPWETIYEYYKHARELLRLACVLIMTILNVIIARRLQLAKQNRRRLKLRPQATTSKMSTVSSPDRKSEMAYVIKSFTEKKLTVLMIAICIIYIIGNIPQTVVMIFQSDATKNEYGFQMFRGIANCFEVLNHCLNFYVFCMASSEYSRAFLVNCLCLRQLLMHIACCEAFMSIRRPSNTGTIGTAATCDPFSQNNNKLRSRRRINDEDDDDLSSNTHANTSNVIPSDTSDSKCKDLVYL